MTKFKFVPVDEVEVDGKEILEIIKREIGLSGRPEIEAFEAATQAILSYLRGRSRGGGDE